MNRNVNLAVADEELRNIVDGFKNNGFPDPVTIEEAQDSLTQNQKDILQNLLKAIEKEQNLEEFDPEEITPDDKAWHIRRNIRSNLQDAVKADLIHLGFIQRHVVTYGAVPDPNENWRYYRLPDLTYAHWKCGGQIRIKEQVVSIHDSRFSLAGSGKTRRKHVPYCEKCQSEPSDRDIENRNPIEDLEPEASAIRNAKNKG